MKEAFLKAIAAAPWDDPEGVRLVYADWLEENGEDDEAERQRGYVAALKGLAPYTREWHDSGQPAIERRLKYPRDYEGEEIPVFDIKTAMDEIEWWKQGVLGKNKYGGGKPWIGFGTNFAQDELEDATKRQEFWRCFEIVTGVEPPEALAAQKVYHCAC